MTDVEDEINSPSHYNEGSKETIDFIEDGMSTEDPVKDLLKAHWYLVKLIDFTKKGSNYEK